MVLEDFVPFDVLQSQLFILRLLSACMYQHWKCFREGLPEPEVTVITSPRVENGSDDTSSITSEHSITSTSYTLPRKMEDPPPLDDSLAKYILSVLSRFLHQMSTQEENTVNQPTAPPPAAAARNDPFTGPSGANNHSTDIIVEIYNAAKRVLFYTSASNWNVVFARIRARIAYLTSTNDEWPETAELKLLECSALNSRRLSMVLQELGTSFLHLKRSAQSVMAIVLHKAIWNWIEHYPAEFVQLAQSQRRLEGGPEILFDICNSLADNPRRKAVFWPLQTMLLILCPDVLLAAAMAEGRGAQSKKTMFLDSLKKSLRSARLADVAAICYVDICKASTYVSKNDMSALRHIVPEIENELKEKLFDPSRPFLNSDNAIDQALMTDCLTALFRLNPRNALRSLIPVCLEGKQEDRAPTAFKLVLVKSCLAIAAEEHRLPWNPSISSMYSSLATPLRKLFQENYSREKNTPSDAPAPIRARGVTMGGNERRQKKLAQEEASDKVELTLNMLRLYCKDPLLAVYISGDGSDHFEENFNLMGNITACLRDSNATIKTVASNCLLSLQSPTYIPRWGPTDSIMETFWKISSNVVFNIARQILEYREREEGLKMLLDLLRQLLEKRNEFLRNHQESASQGSDIRERLAASIALEIALLVLLCSADTEICSSAVICFSHLCTEAQLTEELDDPQHSQLTIVENMAVYIDLANGSGIVTGRKAQQKRIRKLLRMMTRGTPGNLAAWEEAWKRWKILTQAVARPIEEQKEDVLDTGPGRRTGPFYEKLRTMKQLTPSTSRGDIDEEKSSEWQNYTGFLAALGGCCLTPASVPNTPTGAKGRSGSVQMEQTPRRVSAQHDSNHMVDKFVQEMVELLISENVLVREVVKETLGADLSPGLYPNLFRQLEVIVARFFDPDGDVNCREQYTLFVEQAISVLKLVLDRINDPSDNLFTVDFGSLVQSFAKYLNRLGTNHVALRIKVKMCQLCEVLMQKKDCVTLRREIQLRNKLLEIIVEWTSDFSVRSDTTIAFATSSEATQNEKLHRDLDQACLKTIVSLLDKLPLQPSEGAHETNLNQMRSNLFYTYFKFFLKLLNRCRISEAMEAGQLIGNNKTMQNTSLLNRQSPDTVKDLGPLKEYTILALSNLLSANVDSGLRYSLTMAYHDDTKTRTAFMQVLTNILNQGAEFETLAENVMIDRYEKLVDVSSLTILDWTWNNVSRIPYTHIRTEPFSHNWCLACRRGRPKHSIVVMRKNESELFRRTTITTRLVSVFAKNNGAEYMRATLQPVMQDMISKPPANQRFELDPSKVEQGEDGQRNLENVQKTTDAFLNAICASAHRVPRSFREVCYYIATAVGKRFPEAKYTAVGNFIFLRFFCPAIASPESENLVKSMAAQSKEIRRGALLITKVIQNLANNVLFGPKETYMIVLNDFLTNNIYRVTTFLRDISVNAPSTEPTEPGPIVRMDDADYVKLHRFLYDNQERMSADLPARKSRHPNEHDNHTARRAYDKLSTLLAQLGAPAEAPKRDFAPPSTYNMGTVNQLYSEFMRRNGQRTIEQISSKNIFFEGGSSRNGRPVYYYIARRVIADNIDFELLIYYILQCLEPAMAKPFELLLDLTQFGQQNEIPNQWLNQLLQLLPYDIHDYLSVIYIYNANSNLKKYSKKMSRPLPNRLGKKMIFACQLAELQEHIVTSEVRLPSATAALETSHSVTFHPVNKLTQLKTFVPVTIKVSSEYIQIQTTKRQEVFYGFNAILNDVLHVSEIEDVTTVPHSRNEDNNEFSIKHDRGKQSISFSSAKRDPIITVSAQKFGFCNAIDRVVGNKFAIRQSKNDFQMAKPTNITERNIRPNDVPGALLNMALLNIGSEDPGLRLAAYNLLYALSLTFRFDVGNQLLDAKDLCIPANNTSFVIGISDKLASTEPSLTLEFLTEVFVGFNKSSTQLKHLCLEYMAPWLSNLSVFAKNQPDDKHQSLGKTKEIIRLLIDLTVNQPEVRASYDIDTYMYPLVQAKVWQTIGKVDDIINLVLDAFVLFAVEHGVGSHQAETMADTMVTLSSVAVRGKILARLRKVISKTSLKPTRTLTEHPSWAEIAILIRFNLMLSFNNRQPVLHYLPELFHIISILVATGATIIRSSIHGLVVNIVQSLCTSMPLDEKNLKNLHILLSELSENKYKLLFGLTRPNANAFTISNETMSDVGEAMPLASLEVIVNALLDAMTWGAPSIDMANTWRARWMSLVTSTAFQFNPAIQPRAFVVLGCLAQEEVDDDLLYQILVALRGALAIFNEGDCNLIISIMMSLKNIVDNLPSDSRYLQQLFWLAIALVQVGHVVTFPPAVNLLEAVLRSLDANGSFNDETMIDMLLRAREPVAEIAQQLDTACGINFETHFSFAIAGILMKGLKQTTTKNATSQALMAFLEIECKHTNEQNLIESKTLGYLAAMLPIAAKNAAMKELLRMAGIYDVEVDNSELGTTYFRIFDKLDIPDNTTALLLVSLLVTMLNTAENESERLFLYGILAEAAVAVPEVFSLIYESLLPKMNQIVASSQTLPIIDSVKSILYTACSEPAFTQAKTKRSQKTYLEELGFAGLSDCGTFVSVTKAQMNKNAHLASELVQKIIEG
ncbi:hypothetical protein BC938DRAFT_480989 [Jimgerdemannia flammicorona]|uniref:Ras-GAP domain-containing protein n=1 Tax=Jimgerdemannia flammicorona TaxID=994334 RepID=A0A433QH51_9FUNG|nr:hypothetical protein BC938DRAFT_480989 [Jimgerdemannia flammicorona]